MSEAGSLAHHTSGCPENRWSGLDDWRLAGRPAHGRPGGPHDDGSGSAAAVPSNWFPP